MLVAQHNLCISNTDHQPSCVITLHNGSKKLIIQSIPINRVLVCMFLILFVFAGTDTHSNLTYFCISHTCPKHGETLTIACTSLGVSPTHIHTLPSTAKPQTKHAGITSALINMTIRQSVKIGNTRTWITNQLAFCLPKLES